MNKQPVFCIMICLLINAKIGAIDNLKTFCDSENWSREHSSNLVFDDDHSTWSGLNDGETYGWIEYDFETESELFAYRIDGEIPEGTWVSLACYSGGIRHTIPSSFITSKLDETFINIMKDNVITERIVLIIRGSTADQAIIRNIDFITSPAGMYKSKAGLTLYSQSDTAPFYYSPSFLVDGHPGTVWHTWYNDLNPNREFVYDPEELGSTGFSEHQKEYERLKEGFGRQRGFWEISDFAEFRIEQPGSFSDFSFYLNERAGGTLELKGWSEDRLIFLAEISLEGRTGWQNISLDDKLPLEKIRIDVHGNALSPIVIGEVELWKNERRSSPERIDIITSQESGAKGNGILDGLFLNTKSLLELAVVLDRGSRNENSETEDNHGDINLQVMFNGLNLYDPVISSSGGIHVFRYVIRPGTIFEGMNFLSIYPEKEETILSASIAEINSDSIIYQSSDISPEPIVLNSPCFIHEAEFLYSGNTDFSVSLFDSGHEQIPCTITDTFGTGRIKKLFFDDPVMVSEVLITGSTGSYDMRFLGSHENTGRHIEISPMPSFTENRIFSKCITGIADHSCSVIEVNGHEAEILGNYYWIPLAEMDLHDGEVAVIHAEILEEGLPVSSCRTEILFRHDEPGLSLDADENPVYVREPFYTVSGTVSGRQTDVYIDGERIESSHRRFSYNVDLEDGLNLLKVEAVSGFNTGISAVRFLYIYNLSNNADIVVERPADNSYLSENPVTISGYIEGAVDIFSVNINGKPAELSGNRFYSKIVLPAYKNLIEIITDEKYYGKIFRTITINADSSPPLVVDIEPESGSWTGNDTINVAGSVEDESPARAYINGNEIQLLNNRFRTDIKLEEGENHVEIVAVDEAGNRTETRILRINMDSTPPSDLTITTDAAGWSNNPNPTLTFSSMDSGAGISHYEISVDGNPFQIQESPYRTDYVSDGERTIIIKAVDIVGNSDVSDVTVKIDTQAPDTPELFKCIPGNKNGVLSWVEEQDEEVERYILSYGSGADSRIIDIPRTSGRDSDEDGIELFEINLADLSYFPGIKMENGIVYEFGIQAVDRAGNHSPVKVESMIPGGSVEIHDDENGSLVEYENVKLIIGGNSLPERISEITVSETVSSDIAELSDFPIISPIYNFSVISRNGELEEHIELEKDFLCSLDFDESLVPHGFPEQNLGVYYFEPVWSRWFRIPDSVVDTENNRIIFATNHFSEFSIQPNLIEDLSPAELAAIDYPPFKSRTLHDTVLVSPNGGGITTSMTEFVLPGINGLDLEIRRIYDTGTAIGDAAGLTANLNLNLGDVEGGGDILFQLTESFSAGILDQILECISSYFWNNGDYAYSLGQGWRLNFPYIRNGSSTVLVRSASGSFFNVNAMKINTSKTKRYGSIREVWYENHEGEDFTFIVRQVLTPLTKKTMLKTLIDGEISTTVPAWTISDAEMIEKDGRQIKFDALGRVVSIQDPNRNIISFHYSNLLLDYIEDSMGRKVRFEYNDIMETFCVPQIRRIWIEDDGMGREVRYQYDQSGDLGLSIPLPLLSRAVDIGGRKYDYDYSHFFLFSGELGIKVSGVAVIGDMLTGGTFSAAMSKFGLSSITVHGGAQSLWTFPLSKAEGYGLGKIEADYSRKTLEYSELDAADFFLGLLPTAVDLSLGIKQKCITDKLKYHNTSNGLTRIENWHFDFDYSGEKQFYCSESSMNNGRIEMNTEFTPVHKLRPSWSGFDDYLTEVISGRLFTRNPVNSVYIGLEKRKTILDLSDGEVIEVVEMEWNEDRLKLEEIKTIRDASTQLTRGYVYDDWGNIAVEHEKEKISGNTMGRRIYSFYSGVNPIRNFDSLDGYIVGPFNSGSIELSPCIHDRISYQIIENSIPEAGGRSGRTQYINKAWEYDSAGNMTESAVYNEKSGNWYVSSFSYNSRGELTETTTPAGHATRTDHDYSNHPDYYVIKVTHEDVLQGDGTICDVSRTDIYDFDIGLPVFRIDERGWVSQIKYGRTGREISIILPDDGDGNWWNPVENPDPDFRNDNPEISIEYDDDEQTVEILKTTGARTTYYYDDFGKTVEKKLVNRYPVAEVISTVFNYNEYAELISMTDPLGNTYNYLRDSMGKIIREIYPSIGGNRPEMKISHSYDLLQRIITDPNGNRSIEELDFSGNILSRTDYSRTQNSLRSTEFRFDSLGNMIAEKDGEDRWTFFEFDELGQEIRREEPEAEFHDGNEWYTASPVTEYGYNPDGFITEETRYRNGRAISVSYLCNGLGKIISEIKKYTPLSIDDGSPGEPVIVKTFITYDQTGNPVEIIDEEGGVFYKTWSAAGNLLADTDQLGNTVTYTYDVGNRLISMTGSRGNSRNYLDGDFTVEYIYNDLDRLIAGRLPKNRFCQDKPEIIFDYDKNGNLLQRTEPDGQITKYEYDPMKRMIRETRTNTESSVNYTSYISYDNAGNLIEKTHPGGGRIAYRWDELNRIIGESPAVNVWNHYSYDRNNNLISRTDYMGNKTQYKYTPSNLPERITEMDGGLVSYGYDEDDNLTWVKDRLGNIRSTVYNELNHPVTETDSRGMINRYEYDRMGNLSRKKDRRETVFTYTYGPTNLLEVVNAENEGETDEMRLEYDEAGIIKSGKYNSYITRYNFMDSVYFPDPYGLVFSLEQTSGLHTSTINYEYDKRNRMSGLNYPSGETVLYNYNNLGQLTEIPGIIDGNIEYAENGFIANYNYINGVSYERSYDERLRPEHISFQNTNILQNYDFQYDDNSNLIRKNNDYYFYDNQNQLVSASLSGDESVIEYFYEGEPEFLISPWDPLGQNQMTSGPEDLALTPIRLDWGAGSIGLDLGYVYRVRRFTLKIPDNDQTRVNQENTQVYASLYNQRNSWGEPLSYNLEIVSETGNLQFDLSEIAFARYIKIHSHFNELNENGIPLPDNSELRVDQSEPYDITLVSSARLEFYSYDHAGNRLSREYFAGSASGWRYSYYEGSNLIKCDGIYAYKYDGNGNMTEKGSNYTIEGDSCAINPVDDYTIYTYDLFNRLIIIEKYSETENRVVKICEYDYNIDGYRIMKVTNNKTTIFIYDQEGKVLEQTVFTGGFNRTDISDPVVTDYIYLGTKHLARIQDGDTLYYGTDHLGSTVLMTDGTGEEVWAGAVTPFADQENVEGLDENVKFTGKDWDSDAELYYFNARWYDPKLGRFITEDPARDGENWFVYVRNNPMRFIDPTGLESADAAKAWYDAVEEQSQGWEESQAYANQDESLYKASAGYHSGVDFIRKEKDDFGIKVDVTEGSSVFPDTAGIISVQRDENVSSFGKNVRIQLEDGSIEVLGHLRDIAPELKDGSYVDKTTAIGTTGNTGLSEGPHLHKQRYFDIDSRTTQHSFEPGLHMNQYVIQNFSYRTRISFPVEKSWFMEE